MGGTVASDRGSDHSLASPCVPLGVRVRIRAWGVGGDALQARDVPLRPAAVGSPAPKSPAALATAVSPL
jgi:hypothetical protein